jgi:hypothetical protein
MFPRPLACLCQRPWRDLYCLPKSVTAVVLVTRVVLFEASRPEEVRVVTAGGVGFPSAATGGV